MTVAKQCRLIRKETRFAPAYLGQTVRLGRDVLLVALGTFGGVFLTAITPGASAIQIAGGGVVGCLVLLGIVAALERRQRRPTVSSGEIQAARLLVLAELDAITARIGMVRMTRPHPHYSEDFSLPTANWQAYGKVFANGSASLYNELASAYKAIQWVNDAQVMRKTRQGASRLPLAVIEDDRLDEAEAATTRAIATLRAVSTSTRRL